MHRYVKLMMDPFSVLRGYPSIGFGSTLPPPGSYIDCRTRTNGGNVNKLIFGKIKRKI
jgi:hypothetical protein